MFGESKKYWVNKIRTKTSRRCLLWSSTVIGTIIFCTFVAIFLIFYAQKESKNSKSNDQALKTDQKFIPISVNINSKNIKDASTENILYFADLGSVDTVLINTGQSVQTAVQVGNVANATGGPLGTNIFLYVGFTYYFISNNSNGVTGTTIDGKGYPYEVRMLYKNSKYTTIDEAVRNQDGLAEHVFLINICSKPSKSFQVLIKAFQNIPKPGNSTVVPLGIQINAVYTQYGGNYYSYQGSFSDTLTNQTYQCSTVIIFQPPNGSFSCITQEQFQEAFGTLKDGAGKTATYTLQHNTSEIQASLYTNGFVHQIWNDDGSSVEVGPLSSVI